MRLNRNIQALLISQRPVGLFIRISSVALLLSLTVLTVRLMGPTEFGKYTYVYSWLMLLSGLSRGGLANTVIREVSILNPKTETGLIKGLLLRAWQYTLLSAVFVCLSIVIFCIFSGYSFSAQSVKLITVGSLLIPLNGCLGTLEAVVRGRGWVLIGQVGEFVIKPAVTLVILIFLFWVIKKSPIPSEWAMAAAVLASATSVLFAYIYYRKSMTAKLDHLPAFDTPRWVRGLMSISLVIWIATVNSYTNILMLGAMFEPTFVAQFQLVTQMTTLISLGLVAVNAIQATEFSQKFSRGDIAGLQLMAQHSIVSSLAVAMPLFLIFAIAGQDIVNFFFGSGFSGLSLSFLLLGLGQLISASTGSVATLLYATHNEREVVWAITGATIVNFTFCILLIPNHGVVGASVASSVSLAFWNLFLVWRAHRCLGIWCLPLRLKI